eukprot:COSAG03_NODE_1911_length_3365_cov_10.347214_5_plen_371_part_00
MVLLVLPVLPPFCSAQRAGSAASIGAASRTTLKTAWRVLPGALAQIHSLTVGSAACPVMPVQSPQREQNRLPEPTPPTALVPMVPLPTALAVPTRVTKRERTHSHSTPGPSEEQLAAWPEELTKPLPATLVARMLLDDRYQPGRRPYAFDPLGGTFVFKEHAGSLEVVARAPGRPRLSSQIKCSTKGADRWHNSGGKAGARHMAVKGGVVRVRRRYGRLEPKGGSAACRFHAYTLMLKAPPAASNPAQIVPTSPARTATEDTAIAMMAMMGETGPATVPRPAPTSTAAASQLGSEEWVEKRSCTVYHVMPRRPGRGRSTLEEESGQAELWARLAPSLAWSVSDSCINNAGQATGCVAEAFKAAMAQPPAA